MSGSALDVALGLDDWHRERDFYNFTENSCQEGQMCGHYTQVVWAETERVGCGEKFCEKLEGFEEGNMFLLVCNYEPPGNFQGEKPYTPGEACSSCPPAHVCKDSLCAGLEQEETSTTRPITSLTNLTSGVTGSPLDVEPTQPEPRPDPSQPEPTPEPSQPEPTPEPSQPEPTPEPSKPEPTPEPSQPEPTPEPSQPEPTPEPSQPEPTPEPSQPEMAPESPQPESTLELTSKPTQSDMVPKATASELDLLTASDLVLNSVLPQITTVPLDVSTPERIKNSSPDTIVQTMIQSSQDFTPPSQVFLPPSMKPSLPPHIEKPGADKAFANDEPKAPTEKDVMIPITERTVIAVPTRPTKTQDTSILVAKTQEEPVHEAISQDQTRRKDSAQRPPKISPKKKQNLTSDKWKKHWSTSMRLHYKSGLHERTHFGYPAQGRHFGRAPSLSAHPRSPLVLPLYRTNHISPMGGYEEQNQGVSKPLLRPSFKQLCKLLGYKKAVYNLYLSPAQNH
ncbi:uncharacterized protein [Engystomops pustulosus]